MRIDINFKISQIFIFLLISCSNNKEQKREVIQNITEKKTVENTILNIDSARIGDYATVLSEWLNYYKKYSFILTDFEFINEEKLPDLSAKVDTFDFENDVYWPFYKYSPDRSIILDFTSYNLVLEKNELIPSGSDVDSEVSIKDLKNKTWKRILFVGSLYIIEDGF